MRWVVQAEEENLRIDRAIPEHVEESSRAQAKRWCEKGFVRVGGRTVRPSRHLHAGESVEVEVPLPEPAEPEPEDIPLDIRYEDEDLLVIVKPPHMVVHPAPGHYSGTLVNALLHHCSDLSGIGDVARPGIVHRLDQGTSGLIVVAKNHSSHLSLTRSSPAAPSKNATSLWSMDRLPTIFVWSNLSGATSATEKKSRAEPVGPSPRRPRRKSSKRFRSRRFFRFGSRPDALTRSVYIFRKQAFRSWEIEITGARDAPLGAEKKPFA